MTSASEDRLPVSTVELGMWRGDGTPIPVVTSAVCDTCGDWAIDLVVAGSETVAAGSTLTDAKVSRTTLAVVYVCANHRQTAEDELLETYGSCSNTYEPDELAQKVTAERRARAGR